MEILAVITDDEGLANDLGANQLPVSLGSIDRESEPLPQKIRINKEGSVAVEFVGIGGLGEPTNDGDRMDLVWFGDPAGTRVADWNSEQQSVDSGSILHLASFGQGFAFQPGTQIVATHEAFVESSFEINQVVTPDACP